jgi:hypothetical protein
MGAGTGREVVLFVLDAGGGHRAAANALIAAAEQTASPLRFEVVNLKDVLAAFDLTRRITGRSMEEMYNSMVRARLTAGLVPLLRLFQWGIRRLHRPMASRVAGFLASRRPALVVSAIPNFNAVLRDAVRSSHPGTPFVVLLTDLADFTPHFWMEPGVDRVIVGTDRATEQARESGLPCDRIGRTSGMLLHPRFHAAGGPGLRERVRAELGIGLEAFVVLALFGGKGSPELRPLSEALLRQSPGWHVIAICGDNPRLYEGLAAAELRSAGRLHRVGFTGRVAEYLAASDVFVTKPGPASLAEAFHCRVPVVLASNRYTIPQERYNARFVEANGLGFVVRSWRRMPAAVRRLAEEPALREQVRARLGELPENRAVYEVLELLTREAERGPAGNGAPGRADVTMSGAWK